MTTPTACLHCGIELTPRAGTPGRPPDYCGTACRQAAYRRRRRGEPTPEAPATVADTAVRELAQDVLEEARHLVRVLSSPDAPLLDPLEQAANLSRVMDVLTAALVGRARLRRVPWARLGPALSMRPDTARRTYHAEAVSRRMREASPQRRPERVAPPARPDGPEPAPAPRSRSHLAPVLARLQRASRLSLRALAARLDVSPSQMSRVLSGERFPSWYLTERFARACGADPLVLRKVWEAEKLREERPPDPSADTGEPPDERLRTALRTLHVKAGRPTAEVLAEASRHTLGPGDVSAVLAGNLPNWPLLADVVQSLDGDLTYFQSLWGSAFGRRPATPVDPAGADPGPPPRRATDERLVRLFQVFGPVLSAALEPVTEPAPVRAPHRGALAGRPGPFLPPRAERVRRVTGRTMRG